MSQLRWMLIGVCVLAGCSKAHGGPSSATAGTSTATGGAGASGVGGEAAIGGTGSGGALAMGIAGTGTAGALAVNVPLCPWDSGPFVASTPHTPCANEGEQCRLSHHADCALPQCDFQLCDVTVREGVESTYGVFYRSVCKNGFWETEQSGNCAAPEDFICDCPSPEDSALPDEAWLGSTVLHEATVGGCTPRAQLSINRAVDGMMGAHISCTVEQTTSGFNIMAEIDATTEELDLNNPAMPPYTQQFKLEATMLGFAPSEIMTATITSTDSLGQTTQTFTACGVTPRSIVASAMVADFQCFPGPNSDPANAGCHISGYIDIKNCGIGDSSMPSPSGDAGGLDAGDAG